MHFGFALELSNVDLLNIDLLDTHLDLLDTDIPSKYFVCLHNVSKRCLQDVFKTCLPRHLARFLKDVFKTNKCLLGLNLTENLNKKLHYSRLKNA